MMTWGRGTIVEAILLLAAGTAAGFGVNALRESSGKPRIEWDRQYFIRPKPRLVSETASTNRDGGSTASPVASGTNHHALPEGAGRVDNSGRDAESASAATRSTDSNPNPAKSTEEEAHPEHEFTVITTREVLAIVEGTDPEAATTILIDARDAGPYEEGHLPNAYRCYFSTFDADFRAIRDFVQAGYRLVVYCNGGECEDSINLCRMLRDEHGVAEENLLLYEGGWKAWNQDGRPVETGQKP